MDPEQHTRYLAIYKPNDVFWGLGIENETYLQFTKSFAHPRFWRFTNNLIYCPVAEKIFRNSTY